MAVVALTGGIAAGKTVVTRTLLECGVAVIDADEVAREVVRAGEPAFSAIVDQFGPGVVGSDGQLDRGALGTIVFHDDTARQRLNAIVHPAVWERSAQLFSQHHAQRPDVPLVYAIPLLAEGNRRDEFDLVVVVDAPASKRVERLVSDRGMSNDEAQARVSAQATDAQRLAIADVVIDSSGDISHTQAQAKTLAEQLIARWPDSLRAIPRILPITGE